MVVGWDVAGTTEWKDTRYGPISLVMKAIDMASLTDLFAGLPENPSKIERFRNELNEVTWHKDSYRQSLRKLFILIEQLASEELRYYYRRRKTRSAISTITRLTAWATGAVGIVLPLVAAANPHARALSGWGYVFVAAAASIIGADTLFGGTSGHANFVIAQLKIENIIINKRVLWEKLDLTGAFAGDTDPIPSGQIDAYFDVITTYIKEYYSVTSSETEQWQKELLDGMQSIQNSLKKN